MSNLGTNFYPKLVEVSSELGMKPEDIIAIMVSESGINPAAHEAKFNGGGLIGFMPDTLKNLGFKGSPEEFRKLLGEDQLEYVKRNIKNNINFNGSPFKSAAQYYVANFFPVALKLPGIQREDGNTAFIEENPETIYDPKSKRKWSKKYSDIGYKIDPAFESSAYKHNALFHGSTPGAITYKDMMNQVEKNKKTSIYRQALNSLKNDTGYIAKNNISNELDNVSIHSSSSNGIISFFSKIENLLKKFIFASNKNTYLISLASSSDNATKVEYATILSTALKEYLNADTIICQDAGNIEIECSINGDKKKVFSAIKEFSNSLADVFKETTKTDKTFIIISADIKSKYQAIDIRSLDRYARQFQLKRVLK